MIKITVIQSCQIRTECKIFDYFDGPGGAKDYAIQLYLKQPAINIRMIWWDCETGEELEAGDASDFIRLEDKDYIETYNQQTKD